jgi:GH15 family glucan-1,4-alpha-glucosidase
VSCKIEDYALIGDCETAALVCKDGSIDWLCWPRFDSPACFAALLGTSENGRWQIAPADPQMTVNRRYRAATLILETRFSSADGEVVLTDFMPPRGSDSDVVRIVTGVRGQVAMQLDLVLRFDYGYTVPWVTRLDDGALRAIAGPDMVLLRTPVSLYGQGLRTKAEFAVSAGESVPFVMMHAPSHHGPPEPIDPQAALHDTEAFWTEWSNRYTRQHKHRDAVLRSLITLKALTYSPTGGMVAAPTTSLPERLGGSRNWDYRYCWLRDATFTLLALMNGGYYDEAQRWRDWLLRAAAGAPDQLQILYGLRGERRLPEITADWLPGYEQSKPVRIGNAAALQLQLDVYGEVMDAVHQGWAGGLQPSEHGWGFQCALLRHLENIWCLPDEGIWETRGRRQHFTFSKVMAWVAFDRALKSMQQFGLDGPHDRWRPLRDEIHREVCEKGYNAKLNSFTQAFGSEELDASTLLIPVVGFLPAHDKRVIGTVTAIEKRLVRNGFVMRYDTASSEDGMPAGEGAFLACSFWLADAYLMLGRRGDANKLLDRLMSLRNEVGLLSEEYDVDASRLVGNFPQALSHIALVNSVHNLTEPEKPAEQRSGRDTP